jgi:hypothetical protein
MIPSKLTVYSNASLLQMEYGNMGTLTDALGLFIKKEIRFSVQEHEIFVIFIAIEVVNNIL